MADDSDIVPTNRHSGLSPSFGQAGEMLTAKELEQLLKIRVKTI